MANINISQIRMKRGNTAAASTYVGPLGELLVDTGLQTIRIQDGVTPGGWIVTSGEGGGTDLTAVNASITSLTANAGTQQTQINSINANVTAANSAIVTANINVVSFVNTLTSALRANITAANSAIITSNTALKAYTDSAISTAINNLINSAPGTLDTLGEIAANLAADGGALSGIITSITSINSNVSAANAAIITANLNLKNYVDNQISTISLTPGPQGNVGSQGEAGVGIPVGGTVGQVLAKVDGDDYHTEWVDQTGGNNTGNIGFDNNRLFNVNDGSVVLAAAQYSSEATILLPSNENAQTQAITIRNMVGDVAIGVASAATWRFNVEDQSLSLPYGWGQDVSGNAKLSAPNGSITLTSSHGNDTNSWEFGADGTLNLPDGGEIWFSYGYIDQDQDIEGHALRISGGNCVVINTAEDSTKWLFTDDGNLVLPTMPDFTSSPAGSFGGNIVFGDGTVQNTAPLYIGNTVPTVTGTSWYNTEDGRLYVNNNNTWVDASPAVIPGNMVAYESTGNVELRDDASLVFPDGTVQSTAFDTHAGNTAPTSGLIWYNTEDGRTYNKVNGVWVDANPAVLPGDVVTFNDSGNITLPVGGQVTWANGRSILQGITSTGGTVDTGNITFEGMKIIGDNVGVPVPGLISLVPVKTFDGWDFEAWGQYVNIYPTNGFDAPHIHITAGSGLSGAGDIFLGDDYKHVQVNHNGTVYIQTDNGVTTRQWQFGTDGNITLPTLGNINYANGQSILSNLVASTGNITFVGSDITGIGTNVIITADTTDWTFYANANLVLPANGTISYANGQSILSGITGGTSTYGDSNVAAYLTAGNYVTTANITTAINDLIGAAPGTLDTLAEIAANLASESGAIGSITTSIASTNANVTAANVNIATLQSQVYTDSNVSAYLVSNPQSGTYSNTNVASYLTGSITTGNILPVANVTYNLGSPTQQWNSLYVSSNTIYLGGVPLSVSDGTLLVGSSPITANTGTVSFSYNQIKGNPANATGTIFTKNTDRQNLYLSGGGTSNGISFDEIGEIYSVAVGWIMTWADGRTVEITNVTDWGSFRSFQFEQQNWNAGEVFPMTIQSPDYFAGSDSIVQITPNANVTSSTWTFYGNGNVQFPDGSTQTTAYTGGGSTYSNSNVASYLPTYSGNIGAGNIVTTGATSGNISGANYISANAFQVSTGIFWANGTAWSSAGGGTTYSSTGAGNVTIVGSAINLTAAGPGAVATGSSTAIPVVTTDAYGRISSITTAAVVAPAGTLSGSTLNATVTASSLTSVGTLATLAVTGNVTAANIITTGTYGNITGANVISANTFIASGVNLRSRKTILLNRVQASATSVTGNANVTAWSSTYTSSGGSVEVTAQFTAFTTATGMVYFHLQRDGVIVDTAPMFFNNANTHMVVPTLTYISTAETGSHTYSVRIGSSITVDTGDYCHMVVTEF